jgi:hypothetical protein
MLKFWQRKEPKFRPKLKLSNQGDNLFKYVRKYFELYTVLSSSLGFVIITKFSVEKSIYSLSHDVYTQ